MSENLDPREIASHFLLGGDFIDAQPFGNGHINDTFLVRADGDPTASCFVMQHINKRVFSDPVIVMENFSRVSEYLGKMGATTLTLIRTADGEHFHRSLDGEYWRTYRFVPGVTYDTVLNTKQAFATAAMFGRFHALLADLPGPPLHETIPDFHNTPVRYSHFHDAVAADVCDRTRHCSEQIDQALAWEKEAGTMVTLLAKGQVPERVIHNDTKLNNLLFDEASGDPLCVIDLDTLMPGTVLYDFGDMVRTATSPTDEDEIGLSNIGLQLPYYEALVDGFIGASPGFLTDAEIENLSLSGKIITVETGLRFLTDYLCGDEYFKAQRPAQNLDRCKAQFALTASIEDKFGEMQRIVERVASEHRQSSRSQ